MPTYNVHLYREMRLLFPGVEDSTPEEAAKLVAEKATDEAATIDDCEGFSHAALVDLVGDEDFRHSKTIAFDPVKEAAQELYEACKAAKSLLLNKFQEPERTVFWKLNAALAKARGETLPEAA